MTPALVRFVLVRPRLPENLGAAARVLKNFGFDDWALVAPGTHDFASARRVAVHAEDLLDRPRLVRSLDEAVADCSWVVGTSSRRVRRRRPIAPSALGHRAARAGGRLALVFGDERDGLSAAEIARCDDLSTIPAEDAQPSLNLAQAVAVYAYAVRQAIVEQAPPPPGPAAATDAELREIEEALRAALRQGRFLAGPERHAVRDLSAPLRRARLSRREVRLWMAALRRLSRSGE